MRKSIYSFERYREYIRDRLDGDGHTNPRFKRSTLAEKIGVQKSFLSNVLHERVHLSSDQLYRTAEQLGLTQLEADYLLLLLEIERTQVSSRKTQLVARRDRTRRERLKSESALGRKGMMVSDEAQGEYFSTALCPIVHMFLTMPEYIKDPRKLAGRLKIAADTLDQVLAILMRCGILLQVDRKYRLSTQVLHLSEKSRLSRSYATVFRLKAIEHQQRPGGTEDYFFTNSFSADEKTRIEIKAKFLELLAWMAPKISQAPAEEVFHVNFDLFRF